uniref:Uncharacterized protein n=1 Tax=Arundo donax TaxID=35708 RepID=A0A0A9EBA6_ARUDO
MLQNCVVFCLQIQGSVRPWPQHVVWNPWLVYWSVKLTQPSFLWFVHWIGF